MDQQTPESPQLPNWEGGPQKLELPQPAPARRKSRVVPIACLTLALGFVGYLTYEGLLIRQEAQAFESGRYEEAARVIGPVRLLRAQLAAQLQRQVGELEMRGIAADQLPLLQVTGDLTQNPALLDRLELARLQLADPGSLEIKDVAVTFKPAVEAPKAEEPSSPYFKLAPSGEPETAWGATVRLTRKDPKSDNWLPMGEGFAGPLGASYEVLDNGRGLLMANDAGMELWNLETGDQQLLATEGPPEFVAMCPKTGESGMPTIAYSVASDEGDALYLWENGESRLIYPTNATTPLPWLSFEWAPDGQSLLLRWEEKPEPGAGEQKVLSHVAWVRRTGELGFEASLEQELPEIEPTWTASPDGARMALGLGDSFWLWGQGEPSARVLEGVDGVWGFSPDGMKIAGISQGAVYIMTVANPELRTQREFLELPPVMESDGKGFEWTKDRIRFEGKSAEKEDGPFRETTVEVSLGLLE